MLENNNNDDGNQGQQIRVLTNVTHDARGQRINVVTIRTAQPAAPQYGPPAPEPFVPRWKKNRRVR